MNGSGLARRCTVYFIQGETTGLVKIGVTTGLRARMTTLQTHSPDRLILLGTLECENYGALEVELHARFAAARRHGEWFLPTEEILALAASGRAKPIDTGPEKRRSDPFSDRELSDIMRRVEIGEPRRYIARYYRTTVGEIEKARRGVILARKASPAFK